MDRDAITEQIVEFIQNEFPDPGRELTCETDLLNDWFIDSLGVIETVLFLEERFGTKLSRADIDGANFHNAVTIADLVLRRQGA